MRDLFDEGGPYDIQKTGQHEYKLSVPIPTGEDGMYGRECPRDECSPAFFRVKGGTGITDGQAQAFCPYCREAAEPSDFVSQAQVEYLQDVAKREFLKGANRTLRDALGLGTSGKRKLVGGLLSVELSMQPARLPPLGRLVEEELRRDVTCPHCGLEHSVFGLATWCADCGEDIFLTHVRAELAVIRTMLAAVDQRRATLGARVAGRDIENALEDVVSVMEAALKALTGRYLRTKGGDDAKVSELLDKQVRNGFQNLLKARDLLAVHAGVECDRGIEAAEFQALAEVLEKRHPIAHNLGVVDRKYLARIRSGEQTGREIRVTAAEVERALDGVEKVLAEVWAQAFGSGVN